MSTQRDYLRFSLRRLLGFAALVAVACGALSSWLAYIEYLEARGTLSYRAVWITIFYAFGVIGLGLGVILLPLFWLISYLRSQWLAFARGRNRKTDSG